MQNNILNPKEGGFTALNSSSHLSGAVHCPDQ